MSNKNILFLPDLFPRFDGDLHGIFVIDYIKCIKDFFNIVVFYNRLQGPTKGLSYGDYEGIYIVRNTFFNKVPGFLKPLLYILWFLKGYLECIKFKETSLIHAHGIILNGTLAYLASRKMKIPFVITVHQGPFSVISGRFVTRLWAKFILEKADIVCTVSNHLKKEINDSGIFPKKIITTYNPVNTDLFNYTGNNDSIRNMIFVGRLDIFKGAFRCVKAFSLISDNIPGWTLTIVGDGKDMPNIKNFISSNPYLEARIIIKGQLNKEAIAEEFRRSSFMVFPSLHESFGLVLAEAMACGLPVITTNKTAPPEFVDEECGLLIDAEDIRAIADAMFKMTRISSKYVPDLIRRKIVDHFGFKNFGIMLSGIYTGLIEKKCAE